MNSYELEQEKESEAWSSIAHQGVSKADDDDTKSDDKKKPSEESDEDKEEKEKQIEANSEEAAKIESETISPIKAAERAERSDIGEITSLSGTYRLDENGNEIKVEEEKPKVLPKKKAASKSKKTVSKTKKPSAHKPGAKSLIKIKNAKKTVKAKSPKIPAKKIEIHAKKKIPVIKPKILAKKTAIKIKPIIKVKAEASEQSIV